MSEEPIEVKQTRMLAQIEKEIGVWSGEKQLQNIKEIYGKNLSDGEFQTFMQLGIASGLNPFLREIWAIKYDKNSPAQIFIARDGYRKGISRNPNYDSHVVDAVYSNDEFAYNSSDGSVEHKSNFKDRGKLIGAYCLVYMKTTKRPYYVFTELSEYDKGHGVWKTMKATMIKKVAECQCIRMAACTSFSGTYDPDEMVYDKKVARTPRKQEVIDQEQAVDNTEEYEDVKFKVSNSESMNQLNESAALAKPLNLSPEQHAELLSLYKARKSLIEDGEMSMGED